MYDDVYIVISVCRLGCTYACRSVMQLDGQTIRGTVQQERPLRGLHVGKVPLAQLQWTWYGHGPRGWMRRRAWTHLRSNTTATGSTRVHTTPHEHRSPPTSLSPPIACTGTPKRTEPPPHRILLTDPGCMQMHRHRHNATIPRGSHARQRTRTYNHCGVATVQHVDMGLKKTVLLIPLGPSAFLSPKVRVTPLSAHAHTWLGLPRDGVGGMRDPRWGLRGPGSGARGPIDAGSGIRDAGFGIRNTRSGPGSRIRDAAGSGIRVLAWIRDA